jgi:hypothetical protein
MDDDDVAEDLDGLNPPPVDVRLPEHEPKPRPLYDCADDFLGVQDTLLSERQLRQKLQGLVTRKAAEERAWAGTTGYATHPQNTRVVPLCRKTYSREQAEQRFTEMQTRNGWRVVGEPYWTAAYWCWRIACS